MANAPALGGMHFTSQYAVDWAIAHPSGDVRKSLVCRNSAVLEQPLGPLGYQALLGRDVLSHCLLIYDGPSARFTLGY
ncbi:MAG TPA: hypothetical protein VGZ25_08750 [Gemmataceae bacterium]|nr:hypothetical protein [Gemmataceae bacterium]